MDCILNTEKIPNSPGCYMFINKRREIIYIGKSKSLKKRVRQYFYSADTKEGKYNDLLREIYDVEVLLTDTETNALIMECELIKRHKPRYNSQLKKSRVYPYIRVDIRQAYPSITIVGKAKDDGCKYYGCFYSEDDAINAIELINNIWRTPLCRKDSFIKRHKPCLNYHMNRCCAPCNGEIDCAPYRRIIAEIEKCLNGNFYNTMSRLKKEMAAAAGNFDFERAAILRDNINGLENLRKKQKKLCTTLENRDVYLFLRAFNEECFSLFFIKSGLTLNRIDFPHIHELDMDKLNAFINENKLGKTTIQNGSFLTSCILEIGASKLFIPISQRVSNTNALRKLENAYKEFVERDHNEKS